MTRNDQRSSETADERLGRRRFLGLSALTAGSVALGGIGGVRTAVAAPASNRVFDTPRWSSFRSVLPVDDGFLLTGIRTSRSDEQVGWGVRLDEDFDVTWNRSYLSIPHLRSTDGGENHSGIEFALPGDGDGFLLGGWWHDEGPDSRYGWVTRIGDGGIPWWTRVYDRDGVNSFRDDFADGVVTDDGYLLVGRTVASEYADEENGDGWIVEIDDRRGRVRWERAYDPAGPADGWNGDRRHSEFNAVTAIDDGYLLVGETSPDGRTRDTDTAAWALRIDEDGDPLTGRGWTDDGRTYRFSSNRNNEFRDVVAVDDGYLVAGVAGREDFVRELHDYEMRGRAWAAKLDERGRVEWQDDPGGEGFYAVEPAGDGGVFVGRRDGRAWAVAYDGDGDRLGSYRPSISNSGYAAVTARRRNSRREFYPVGYGRQGGSTSGLGTRLTAADLDADDGGGDDGDDDDDDDERLLEIVATESGDVRYEFTVDGDVERARVTDRIKAEPDDRIRENRDGTVTVRGSTGNRGFGDAFRFTGDVTEFESRGDADFFLRLDGERVDVDELVDDDDDDDDDDGDEDISLLEIVATESGDVRYEFTVDGDAVRAWASERVKAEDEDDDRIRENSDGTVTVRGATGNEGFGDAFGFTGRVTEFESRGDADFFIRVDGDRVDVDELVDDDDDDETGAEIELLEIVATEQGDVRYEFTVDGDAVRAWASERIKAEDEDDDRIRENRDGTVTVRGATGNRGYGDAFGITGDVIEFESRGDADFYIRVDGDRVGVDELVDD